jgi:ABC-type cobalt transport system substrate-binding protein
MAIVVLCGTITVLASTLLIVPAVHLVFGGRDSDSQQDLLTFESELATWGAHLFEPAPAPGPAP